MMQIDVQYNYNINEGCFSMDDNNYDKVLQMLFEGRVISFPPDNKS